MAQSGKTQPGDMLEMVTESEYSRYQVGIPQDIQLRVYVNARSQDVDFETLLPPGISFRMEEVYVSIDGREPVRLINLQDTKVGRGCIRHNLNDSYVLFLWDVSLQGENGSELQLLIRDASFRKAGNYPVKILMDMLQDGTQKVFQNTLVLSCKAEE